MVIPHINEEFPLKIVAVRHPEQSNALDAVVLNQTKKNLQDT